jgi:hypothetical protein
MRWSDKLYYKLAGRELQIDMQKNTMIIFAHTITIIVLSYHIMHHFSFLNNIFLTKP